MESPAKKARPKAGKPHPLLLKLRKESSIRQGWVRLAERLAKAADDPLIRATAGPRDALRIFGLIAATGEADLEESAAFFIKAAERQYKAMLRERDKSNGKVGGRPSAKSLAPSWRQELQRLKKVHPRTPEDSLIDQISDGTKVDGRKGFTSGQVRQAIDALKHR